MRHLLASASTAWQWAARISTITTDPAHALAAGKEDLLGERRHMAGDRGKALAASSTLNRLELAAEAPDDRYRRIVADARSLRIITST